jgi:hypothetical protein
MEPTRAAIAAIQNQLKGELSVLSESLLAASADDDGTLDQLAEQFRSKTNQAVWEAINTLASHIDHLRATKVTASWVQSGEEAPQP